MWRAAGGPRFTAGCRPSRVVRFRLGRRMPNYTILLIDYEPKSIDRVRRPLTGVGYRVEVATDGVSGIEAFHRLKPDLVMIEAMIPKRHGFEVCQELKKTPHGKHTPIIITTSVYKGRKYRNQAFHLHGCDEYIEKPIDEVQIVEICKRMLGDTSTTVPASVEATFPETHEASADDDAIALPLPGDFPEPPMPVDEDELEIMARLDAILPGGGSGGGRDNGGKAQEETAHIPEPAPAPSPRPHVKDPFATSFLPDPEPSPTDRDVPAPSSSRYEPVPLEEGTTSIPLATGSAREERTAHEEPSTAVSVSAGPTEDEEDRQVVSFESGRSRKKERRKKVAAASSASRGQAATAVAAPALDTLDEKQSQSEAVARVEPAADARPREEAKPAVVEAEPVVSYDTAEERNPWWLPVAIALVLLGAAGALIYLYLGGLFGGTAQ